MEQLDSHAALAAFDLVRESLVLTDPTVGHPTHQKLLFLIATGA